MDYKKTLSYFLHHKTQVGELCVIRDCGYDIGVVSIDYEDLWVRGVNPNLLDEEVKGDCWGTMPVVDARGIKTCVPVHYVDV
jgi:hypothetical protein